MPRFLQRLIDRLADARARAGARRELMAMSRAQLSDLGISRDQIDAYLDGVKPHEPAPRPRLVVSNSGPRCCPTVVPCCKAA